MRTVRIGVVHDRDQMALVLRARFERTFFGLGLCTACVLYAAGVYLLMEAIREPLEASEATVLAAGFTLGLGSFAIV